MLARRLLRFVIPLLLVLGSFPAAQAAPFTSERIRVAVEGEGPDVILIGGLASSPEIFRGAIRGAPGYRYHLMHVYGFSGLPARRNATGPVAGPVAEEIARYIRQANFTQRPAIIGHSLGGTQALMIAARHPERVGKVLVVDIPPFIGAALSPTRVTAQNVAPFAHYVREAVRSPYSAQFIDQLDLSGIAGTGQLRAAITAQTNGSNLNVTAQAMYDLITTDLRGELRNIEAPLRVIYARAPGRTFSDAQTDVFYRNSYQSAPHLSLARIPNADHMMMLHSPQRFGREFRDFLAS